jgi:hypothetical protein
MRVSPIALSAQNAYQTGTSRLARIGQGNLTLLKTLKSSIGASSPLRGGDLAATTAVHPHPYCWERTYVIIEIKSTSTTT